MVDPPRGLSEFNRIKYPNQTMKELNDSKLSDINRKENEAIPTTSSSGLAPKETHDFKVVIRQQPAHGKSIGFKQQYGNFL